MKEGRKGGKLVGDAHSAPSGGIPALVVDTGETVLIEGKEVIINKSAVESERKNTFNGKQMTNKEILSAINQSAGNGVPILENGGQLKQGIAVEREHEQLYNDIQARLLVHGCQMPISKEDFFAQIATAHIAENKNYYDLLEKYVEGYGGGYYQNTYIKGYLGV